MEAINLDLLPGAMPPIVHVSQGDVGRQFQISIYDDTGAAYSLTGKTVSIVGSKGDGYVFQYDIPSSAISGNTVTITTEEQMTPAAGKALCEIRIEQSGTKLGTCNFVMDVERSPTDIGILSDSELNRIDVLLERAQTDINTSINAATTATQKASEAAASATSAAESLAQSSDAVDVATAKATAAANSASAAATSETNAASSASVAEDAKAKIEGMTVSAQSVDYTKPASVAKTVESGVVNLDFQIPRGQPTSGHDVEVNPTGDATGDDITKLGIDGTIYNLAGGGGNALRFSEKYISLMVATTPNITGFALNCQLMPSYYVNGSWNIDDSTSGQLTFDTGFVAATDIQWGQPIPNMEWTTPPASQTYPSATDSKWVLVFLEIQYYYDDNTLVANDTPFKDMSYVPIIGAAGTQAIPSFMQYPNGDEYPSLSKYSQTITEDDFGTSIKFNIGHYVEDIPNNGRLLYPQKGYKLAVVVC